ncbi:MAG TPA: hypothetical protein VF821_03290 [Lentzea sp.]
MTLLRFDSTNLGVTEAARTHAPQDRLCTADIRGAHPTLAGRTPLG